MSKETIDFNTELYSNIIRKNSLKSFTVEKKINDIINTSTEEKTKQSLKEVIKILKQMDKELLNKFEIKLTEKEKENAFKLMELLK